MGLRRGCGSRLLAGFVGCGLCAGLGALDVIPTAQRSDAVQLSSKILPLSSATPSENRVGSLTYRGGLEITSADARFGGWSGLLVSADGSHLLSQSDEGHWLRARLSYAKSGNLAGIADAQLADMQGADGAPLKSKLEADAESLAALTEKGPDGQVGVSFERDARVWRYDLSGSLETPATNIPTPDDIKTLDFNSGLEGLTRIAPNTLLAVAEIPQIRGEDHSAWMIPISGQKPGTHFARLSVKHHNPYEISDAAMSPSGRSLYLLERHYFGPFRGVVVAVRRIDASTIKPAARLDGPEIARFTMHENIDNMEGLALRRDTSGRTLLYMISDDNYNLMLQRTVLLMFEVEDDPRS
ncbi:MAG: esterase-like activity of phytase family protein [Alphaproteobacteria bacterium]